MAATHFACLVLTLFILSASAEVFYSIDCGSSTPHRDENLISWVGDDEYIGNNGEPHSVPSSNSISPVMDTLRVFTTKKKNCYQIDSMKPGKVLVRASFYYGNYDQKSSPPTFGLQFDGNNWNETVMTSSTEVVSHEVIYVMKKNSISVCLALTHLGQFPFISALEVRLLQSYMYANIDNSLPLLLRRRLAFAQNSIIRYPDDPFDRIWSPATTSGLIKLSSNANFTNLETNDRPPPAVLKNAVTASTRNSSIRLSMDLPDAEVTLYLNFYFSEIVQLEQNQTRSFILLKNNETFYGKPIIPPYENCTQIYSNNTGARGPPSIMWSFVPTINSTHPPLINAIESFFIGDELTDGTNPKDVQGLASLQKAFSVLEDWKGDPCLPSPYSWDWINCSTDSTPRVIALFLGNFGLSGTLPDFSSMDALQTIDLHNNSLQGPIPDFLGTLLDLKTLNLANNEFKGSIPASLSTKKDLNLLVTDNPDLLCTSTASCPISKTSENNFAYSTKVNNIFLVFFGTIIPIFFIIPL